MMTFVRRRGYAPKTFNEAICATMIGLAGFAMAASPASGYCWYYTDPGQQQGFWDVCPQ